MIDKIKVNLSYYVYNTILEDMIRFECFKPNGDVNRNGFLNVIINNFYYNKLRKRKKIEELLKENAILTEVSEKNSRKILEAASRIMDDYYHEDLDYKYHQYYFMIYPTKSTQVFFDTLYENEIKNSVSISSFIRKLLNEYAYLPQYVRENVVKRKETLVLDDACETNSIIIFNVSGTEYKLAPFDLIVNREETYSYLLGLDLNSKDNHPISIKLSKIHNVVVTKDKYKFSKEEHNSLTEIIINGVEFASSELITVKLKVTRTGVKMLKIKSHNRPLIKQIDDELFEISCSISNFINYFVQFGKEITILDNDELKIKFYEFYKNAEEHYKC